MKVSVAEAKNTLPKLGRACVPAVRPHHADPFDRQIITQALVEKVTVVTPDDAFSFYQDLKVVW
jgi:PIN domain nuclease of toxin-antitoxin system